MISEMTESKKHQPLYCLVDYVHWIWSYLFRSHLYVSYITLIWEKATFQAIQDAGFTVPCIWNYNQKFCEPCLDLWWCDILSLESTCKLAKNILAKFMSTVFYPSLSHLFSDIKWGLVNQPWAHFWWKCLSFVALKPSLDCVKCLLNRIKVRRVQRKVDELGPYIGDELYWIAQSIEIHYHILLWQCSKFHHHGGLHSYPSQQHFSGQDKDSSLGPAESTE